MPKIKKAVFALPSLFTLGAAFCAFLSITLVLEAQHVQGAEQMSLFYQAAVAIIGSIFFDTFDGKVARLTHTSSRFGMELDSLADAVSFGIAPAVLIYGFALSNLGIGGLLASFVFLCGTLLRLARFNIEAPEEGVQAYFKGIPSPGGAACIAAIVMVCIDIDFTTFTRFELNTLAGISIGVGLLMVSNVKYKTFKGKIGKFDIAFIVCGLLLFAGLTVWRSPAMGFFALTSYFVSSGILLTIYHNLKHGPRRSRRLAKAQLAALAAAGKLEVDGDCVELAVIDDCMEVLDDCDCIEEIDDCENDKAVEIAETSGDQDVKVSGD